MLRDNLMCMLLPGDIFELITINLEILRIEGFTFMNKCTDAADLWFVGIVLTATFVGFVMVLTSCLTTKGKTEAADPD